LNYGAAQLIVPATAIGIGAIFVPNKYLNITTLLLSGTECTKSDCFEDMDDKEKISAATVNYQ
jgi:hypothetical protein